MFFVYNFNWKNLPALKFVRMNISLVTRFKDISILMITLHLYIGLRITLPDIGTVSEKNQNLFLKKIIFK